MKSVYDYEAAIFDLDGTLTDSMHVWKHIGRDWLLQQGVSPPETLERDLKLMTLTQSAEYMIDTYGINLIPQQIIAMWERMVLRKYEETVPLKEGAAELLRSLSARGVKLAVATSCFPAACEAVLQRFNIRALFSAIIYTDEVRRDKTFPDLWLFCAKKLDVPPEKCIVFEDLCAAGVGIRAAGMGFVAVYDESCKDWDTQKIQADLSAVSLRELCLHQG